MNDKLRRLLGNPWLELIARWVLGLVFLVACVHKMLNPAQFAKIIYGYQLFPHAVINLIAITLPFIEFYAGAALVLGIYPKSAALLINAMLLSFIVAISINLARGHAFDCGCFSLRDTQSPASAVTLLVRDVACLVLGAYVMSFSGKHKWSVRAAHSP